MKFAAVLLIIALSAINIEGATIADCVSRIVSTQQYLNSEVSKLRSEIGQSISQSKSTLNSRASAIKSEINGGSEKCKVWISQIDTILKGSVNFQYAFSPCEKTSEINALARTKNSLNDLNKQANKLMALCTITNCQGSIDSLYNSIGAIESNIGSKSADIQAASKRCVEERTNNPSRSLESAYSAWKKCS